MIRVYNADKTINKNVIFGIIKIIIEEKKVKSDKELATYLKYILNKLGLNVYIVYCAGDTQKYTIKIASKFVVFEKEQAKFIVESLKENRKHLKDKGLI